MDPNATRLLGSTDVTLSQLGFGGAPLGDMFVKVPELDAQRTLAAAWAENIRYFDTSPWYGRGQSEHRFGRFLYQQPREQFVLSTKVGRTLRRSTGAGACNSGIWAGGLRFDVEFNYSYGGIMRSFEDSLQRLGMDRVDLLLIHDLDFWHHKSEAKVTAYLSQLATSGWRALTELRDQGSIRGIGAGINELGIDSAFPRPRADRLLSGGPSLHPA
jgi:D-threo-aldose 1-dehydrogenase